jgi:ribosome-associated toxin RatA of RatAB toxin-antitoxin module
VTLSSDALRLGWGSPDSSSTLVQREIVIVRAPDLAWDLQVRVNDWPSWQPHITDAWLSERMGAGARFQWSTLDTTFDTRVEQFTTGRTLSWSALGDGLSLIQEWTFVPAGRGVQVIASELRWGSSVDDSQSGYLASEAFLETWLANLKAEVNART